MFDTLLCLKVIYSNFSLCLEMPLTWIYYVFIISFVLNIFIYIVTLNERSMYAKLL